MFTNVRINLIHNIQEIQTVLQNLYMRNMHIKPVIQDFLSMTTHNMVHAFSEPSFCQQTSQGIILTLINLTVAELEV